MASAEKKAPVKKRMPKTTREIKFVKALVTAPSATEAARIAGYKDPKQSAWENKTKLDLEGVLRKAGVTVDTLAEGIKEGLSAKKIHGTSDDFIEIDDMPTRLNYIKEAGEWLGLKKDNDTPGIHFHQHVTAERTTYALD